MTYSLFHAHTDRSLLDGFGTPDSNVQRAKDLGIHSMGVSDHGNCFAHVKQLEAAEKYGIRRTLGNELYICHKPAYIKHASNRNVTHMVVFAKNKQGWQELIKLTSQTNHPDAFYYKPRISLFNYEVDGVFCPGLEQYLNGNIFGISGHMGSHLCDNLFCNATAVDTEEKIRLKTAYAQSKISDLKYYKQFLKPDWLESTCQLAVKLEEIFGKGNFYVELQDECNPNDLRPL